MNNISSLRYLTIFMAIGSFAIGVDAYVIGGLLTHIASSIGVSASSVGLLISSYMLCYGLFSPVLAAIIANFRARSILGLAMLIFIMANLLSAFSYSFSCILMSRIIAGLGAGLYMPFAITTIASLAPENKKGSYLSILFGGMAVGTIMGVPIGLLLTIHFGWRISFLFVSLIGMIAFIAQLWTIPIITVIAPPSLKHRLKVMKDKNVIFVIIVSTICAMGGLSLYSYLPLILQSFSINQHMIVIDILAWGTGGLIGSFLSGHILDHLKEPFLMVAIMITMILLCIILIPFIPTFKTITLVVFSVWGMSGWGLQVPQQFLIHKFGPNYGAISVSLALSMRYLGIAVGTAIISLLLSWGIRPKYLPFIASTVILAALCIHIFYVWRRHLVDYNGEKYEK